MKQIKKDPKLKKVDWFESNAKRKKPKFIETGDSCLCWPF